MNYNTKIRATGSANDGNKHKPTASPTALPEIEKEELDSLFQTYLKEKEFLQGVTQSTILFYKDSMRAWKKYEGVFTEAGIKEFTMRMGESGMKPGAVNTFARGMNSFFTWLHEEGHTAKRFKIRMRKVQKRVLKTYSKSDMDKVVAYEPTVYGERRMKALILLFADTGVRISEALGLTRKDVDLKEMCITVLGKGRKERTLPISPAGKKALRNWMKNHEHSRVFCTRDGTKLNFNNLRRELKSLLKAAKVEKCEGTFHTFRRYFAKQYARNGGNLFDLQTTMGHTTLEMTRRYTAVDLEDLRLKHKTASPLMNLMKSQKKKKRDGGNNDSKMPPDNNNDGGTSGAAVSAASGNSKNNHGSVKARLIKKQG
jgi:site-specific recombinase XerD